MAVPNSVFEGIKKNETVLLSFLNLSKQYRTDRCKPQKKKKNTTDYSSKLNIDVCFLGGLIF